MIAPDQIRSRVAVHVLSTMGTSWVEATVPWALLPDNVSRQTAHRCFAVGIPRSTVRDGRQRLGVGIRAQTEVGLRALCRVRAEVGASDPLTLNDEDAALKDEAALVRALHTVAAVSGVPELGLTVQSMDRRYVGDGTYLLIEIASTVEHLYPL